MATFFIAFFVFSIALMGMAVGVLLGGKPIKGSCGGIGNIDGLAKICGCEDPCEKKKARIAELAQKQPEV